MKQAGFTLVELLVSISIIVVMMGVGLPAFQTYGRTAELKQAGTDVQGAMLQAHNLALAPEADKPSADDYYGVSFNPQNTSYDLIRGVHVSTGACPTTPTILEHHVLPLAISMTPSVAFCVGYLVGRGAEPSIDPALTSIAITSNRLPGTTMSIQVNQVTGQVTVQ